METGSQSDGLDRRYSSLVESGHSPIAAIICLGKMSDKNCKTIVDELQIIGVNVPWSTVFVHENEFAFAPHTWNVSTYVIWSAIIIVCAVCFTMAILQNPTSQTEGSVTTSREDGDKLDRLSGARIETESQQQSEPKADDSKCRKILENNTTIASVKEQCKSNMNDFVGFIGCIKEKQDEARSCGFSGHW